MSDPTQPVINAAAAGAGAVFVAMIGVEPQALVWASVGAAIGLGFAAQTGRFRAAALFVAVAMACALLGTLIAARWFDNSAVWRNSSALLLGIAFHPLLALVVAQLPAIVDAALRKVGLKA